LAVHVDRPKWDEGELEKLISGNPELIDYLPNKDDQFKGINWIKKVR
jgi:hypothetical protein